jgi:putative transposase
MRELYKKFATATSICRSKLTICSGVCFFPFVMFAPGKTTPVACRENGITEQTYYRWRKEYGGLQVDQARRLKELEQENAKLKRLVSELSLEKLELKDIASGNF